MKGGVDLKVKVPCPRSGVDGVLVPISELILVLVIFRDGLPVHQSKQLPSDSNLTGTRELNPWPLGHKSYILTVTQASHVGHRIICWNCCWCIGDIFRCALNLNFDLIWFRNHAIMMMMMTLCLVQWSICWSCCWCSTLLNVWRLTRR